MFSRLLGPICGCQESHEEIPVNRLNSIEGGQDLFLVLITLAKILLFR